MRDPRFGMALFAHQLKNTRFESMHRIIEKTTDVDVPPSRRRINSRRLCHLLDHSSGGRYREKP